MSNEKINQLSSYYSGKMTKEAMFYFKERLLSVPDDKFTQFAQFKMKSPALYTLISLMFGIVGIDCFLTGRVGRGVFKLLTVGGFYILWIWDVFTIGREVKQINESTVADYLDFLGH